MLKTHSHAAPMLLILWQVLNIRSIHCAEISVAFFIVEALKRGLVVRKHLVAVDQYRNYCKVTCSAGGVQGNYGAESRRSVADTLTKLPLAYLSAQEAIGRTLPYGCLICIEKLRVGVVALVDN